MSHNTFYFVEPQCFVALYGRASTSLSLTALIPNTYEPLFSILNYSFFVSYKALYFLMSLNTLYFVELQCFVALSMNI
ncbi:MAG: hypothetical protein Q4C98_08745 [Capnocytophaga sp.]|nr:hypothetical protein [Capnocytophaga sp.]